MTTNSVRQKCVPVSATWIVIIGANSRKSSIMNFCSLGCILQARQVWQSFSLGHTRIVVAPGCAQQKERSLNRIDPARRPTLDKSRTLLPTTLSSEKKVDLPHPTPRTSIIEKVIISNYYQKKITLSWV